MGERLKFWCVVLIVIAHCFGLVSCSTTNESKAKTANLEETQIAFIADIHLHDIYAKLVRDKASDAMPEMPLSNEQAPSPLLIRSMQAQLNSTRLFNENYFVFIAALDDLVARGVKLVALPGDFSDDGQPINVRGANRILSYYAKEHGMRFFTITGNHDPVRPFTQPAGKKDFLGASGQEIRVYSPDHPQCANPKQQVATLICSHDIEAWGYKEIMATLSGHGFSPAATDILYETPFGTSEQDKRGWEWCDNTNACIFMPDASYLVEPQEGVWLLAIDANVYVPKGDLTTGEFSSSSNTGYNALLTYKPKLIDWITTVVDRAQAQGKRLVAFSHYPMVDFYDNTRSEMKTLFGEKAMHLVRLPTQATTEVLANTGMKLHLAGHMHLFDIGEARNQNGSELVNVQVPSLAAYQPGYSLVTLLPNRQAKVETIILDDIPEFKQLFPFYQTERRYREAAGLPVWAERILASRTFLDYTDEHLQSVVRHRYLKKEWPVELVEQLQNHTLGDLFSCHNFGNAEFTHLQGISGMTLAYDYYRIKNAGQFADLKGRLSLYRAIQDDVQCNSTSSKIEIMLNQLIELIITMDSPEDTAVFVVDGI